MKSIPCNGLLGLIVILQMPYQELVVGQDISPIASPLAFYRRTIITQERETIGSLGGAPVGVYRRRQSPYRPSFSSSPKIKSRKPRHHSKQFKETELSSTLLSGLFTESIENSTQNFSVAKKFSSNSKKRVSRSRIPKIIRDLLKADSQKELKSKLVSFGLGVGLGTILGSILPKELFADK